MTSSPPTELMFSQVREDPLLDLDVCRRVAARRGQPARVLLVASGGCTAVALLAAPEVAEVHAVDANPAQLHLTALRHAAAMHLAPAAQRVLLGEGDAGARLALYQELRTHLSPAAREHWDAREPELAFGPNRVGRFEELFRELARTLAEKSLHDSCQQVFERGKLARIFGEAAVAYSMDRSFADHFEAQLSAALARWPLAQNYFLHQIMKDCYPDESLPPVLIDGFRAAAARLGPDRLELHHGRFADRLPDLGRFDVIQMSNISDWMPQPELDALLARVRSALNPGGAVIGRRLNGDHVLADFVARHFELDRALSAKLLAADRSFFYREVVVGWA